MPANKLDSLLAAVESCPDSAFRNTAGELVAALMELHGSALARTLELVTESQDPGLLEKLAGDPQIRTLLLVHGLHPSDLQTRVSEALEQVRPALKQHRGDVELVAIEDGTVRLRLLGTCNGCPSSTSTFRNLIENAVYELAPEIENIEVEGITAK